MLDRLNLLELNETGSGHRRQSLAGGIGNQMEVKALRMRLLRFL
jgi:hypothetical protein